MVFDEYILSEHGKQQAEQPLRYESAFGCYDRQQMLTDLGPDVDPVKHMFVTRNSYLTVLALEEKTDEWSPADIIAGESAALLHDIGECTHPQLIEQCGAVVGDIPQGMKTDEQIATEKHIRQALYQLYCSRMPDSLLERVECLVAHRESSPVQQALETAHDVNTFKIGLRAAQIAIQDIQSNNLGSRLKQFSNMAGPVTLSGLQRVEHHASTFRYARLVLDREGPLYEYFKREI